MQVASNGDVTYSSAADGIVRAAESAVERIDHRLGYTRFGRPVPGRAEVRKASRAVGDIARSLGLGAHNKHVTPGIEACSSEFTIAFLRGYFDADGSVQGTQAKGASVRLTQCSLPDLEAVQRMLLRLGIVSTIYRNRSLPATSSCRTDAAARNAMRRKRFTNWSSPLRTWSVMPQIGSADGREKRLASAHLHYRRKR